MKDTSKKPAEPVKPSEQPVPGSKPVMTTTLKQHHHVKKNKAPGPPIVTSKPIIDKPVKPTKIIEPKIEEQTSKPEVEPVQPQEESGYDSDQTLSQGALSKDSASETESAGSSNLNSPIASVKKPNHELNKQNKQEEEEEGQMCDSDVEQDLSLESIIVPPQNHEIGLRYQQHNQDNFKTKVTSIDPFQKDTLNQQSLVTSLDIISMRSQPSSMVLTNDALLTTSDKYCSLDPSLITSVEVNWGSHSEVIKPSEVKQFDGMKSELINNNAEDTNDDILRTPISDDQRSCSSIPMDFGDSLPPTLTNLIHKQFSLYRLYKEAEAELGVLITKKVQRDRRTSGYVIAYIEPGGLVDKDSRFKIGDELINVNGHSLRGLSMEAARNVLRHLSGHVDIIVARQPQEAVQASHPGIFLNK